MTELHRYEAPSNNMPYCFEGKTADSAWRQAADVFWKTKEWTKQRSQHGVTRELLHASFHIHEPRHRWVLSRHPGINPAFAIAEAFWILAGRRDAKLVNYWNRRLPALLGRHKTYHGAYGSRLRNSFGFDQLERAYQALDRNPESRQIVLAIWNPGADFPSRNGSAVSRDVPCNVCSLLKVRNGRLEWTQIMRSNDLCLGTPHNFVQFTVLQEIVAGWLQVEVGAYFHVSDSLHVYEKDTKTFSSMTKPTLVRSADSLGLSKGQSDKTLVKVIEKLEALSSHNLSRQGLRAICASQDVPSGYRNLILIAAADSARRRAWYGDMDHAADECANPALSLAWERWRLRHIRGGER